MISRIFLSLNLHRFCPQTIAVYCFQLPLRVVVFQLDSFIYFGPSFFKEAPSSCPWLLPRLRRSWRICRISRVGPGLRPPGWRPWLPWWRARIGGLLRSKLVPINLRNCLWHRLMCCWSSLPWPLTGASLGLPLWHPSKCLHVHVCTSYLCLSWATLNDVRKLQLVYVNAPHYKYRDSSLFLTTTHQEFRVYIEMKVAYRSH